MLTPEERIIGLENKVSELQASVTIGVQRWEFENLKVVLAGVSAAKADAMVFQRALDQMTHFGTAIGRLTESFGELRDQIRVLQTTVYAPQLAKQRLAGTLAALARKKEQKQITDQLEADRQLEEVIGAMTRPKAGAW